MERFRMQEQRFTALREMLEYGVYHVVQNLKIEGYTSREPLPFSEKKKGAYRLWQPGEHWGNLFDCGSILRERSRRRPPESTWLCWWTCLPRAWWWIRTETLSRD